MFGQSQTLLTTKQLAEKLGISVATIERWRANNEQNQPPYIRLSSGAIRYNPTDIQKWLDSRTAQTDKSKAVQS